MLLTSRPGSASRARPLTRGVPRPWSAAVCTAASGAELAYFPLRRPELLPLQGLGGTSVLLIAAGLGACAVLMVLRPARAVAAGFATIVLGMVSCPMANLGGFLIGMLLAVTGGSLAAAWRQNSEAVPGAR